jgi:hypothetical protein
MSATLRAPQRARSSTVRRGLVQRGLAAAGIAVVVASGAAACAPAKPSASQLYVLRMCESGGRYAINTGNGFYGAYQFSVSTWRGLGFSGYPHQASPATQDAAVRKLYGQRGWSPWPVCGLRARNA